MKKDFYNSYCIRVSKTVDDHEYFVTYVYADGMNVRCYENGMAWIHFYMGGTLVMSCEADKCFITAKQVQSDEYSAWMHFDYEYRA